jgi:hypothetical protein
MGRKALLSAFAIIGFFLGVAAYYMGKNLAIWIERYLPLLSGIDWIIAGIAGAVITVIIVVVWAYATS